MTDQINRALCCGPTCGRGTDATGPCVAPIYGASIRQRVEAAGYVLVRAGIPRCGDHVRHRPSCEKWIVAWADETHLAWAGWPTGVAMLSDCDILYRATDAEHRQAVREWQQASDRPIRTRVLHLYGAAIAEGADA
jgi:hypothetical protein